MFSFKSKTEKQQLHFLFRPTQFLLIINLCDVDRLDDDIGVVNDKILDDDDEDAADADAVDNDDDDDDDDNIVDAVVDVVTGVMLDPFRFLFLRVLRPPSSPLSFATKRILTATPFVLIW